MRKRTGAAAATVFLVVLLCASVAEAAPDYRAKLRSSHPGAVPAGYTYRGDTVVASFRDLNLGSGRTRHYRVCYRHNWKNVCARKTLDGSAWSRWRVYVGWRWAGKVNGQYVGYIPFKWKVASEVVAKRRIWIYGE